MLSLRGKGVDQISVPIENVVTFQLEKSVKISVELMVNTQALTNSEVEVVVKHNQVQNEHFGPEIVL